MRLEPLNLEHVAALWRVAAPGDIFRWYTAPIRCEADLRGWVAAALKLAAAGSAVPFATLDAATGEPIGSTRFGAIDTAHRRVEIGWTWLAPARQRTAANTEAKLLMLAHAFETWGCIRVELKTDSLNEASRAAILRLGAVEEGTLRHHMVCADGRRRDTVMYSILADEWPAVRARLEERLAAG